MPTPAAGSGAAAGFWPSLKTGLGNVAASLIGGAAGSLFGGKNNPPPASAYRDATWGDIWGRMLAAEKWKIHPLYLLGSGSGSSPVTQSSDSGVSQMVGAGVSDAIRHAVNQSSPSQMAKMARQKQEAQELAEHRRAQREVMRSEAERNEAAAILDLSRAARERQEGNPQPSVKTEDQLRKERALYIRVWNPIKKRWQWHVNVKYVPELGELAGAGFAGTAATSNVGEVRDTFDAPPYVGNVTTRRARRLRRRGQQHLRR